MCARNFIDAYCALTVPDNMPFNPKDYEQEAQQFLDDNLYTPEEQLARAAQRSLERMVNEMILKALEDSE